MASIEKSSFLSFVGVVACFAAAGLILIGLVVGGWDKDGLLSVRAVATFLAMFLPLVLAWQMTQRLWIQLTGTVLALAAPIAAWWLVPTASGISLMTAHQEAEAVANEYANRDILHFEGHEAVLARFEPIQIEFPGRTAYASSLISNWIERNIVALTEDLNSALPGDDVAFRRYSAIRLKLPLQRVQLTSAEERWAEQTARQVVDAAREQAKTDPSGARQKYAECRKKLVELPFVGRGVKFRQARTLLCSAALDAARWKLRPLIAADQFGKAAHEAKLLVEEWNDEAVETDLANDYKKFREGFEYMAALDRLTRSK